MKCTISKKFPTAAIALVCVVAIVMGGCGAGNNGGSAASPSRSASSGSSRQSSAASSEAPPLPFLNTPAQSANAKGIDGGVFVENGGWFYYRNHLDGQKLYKMRTDDSNITKLSDDTATSIVVIGDWVYYSGSDGLYKIRADGSGREKLDDADEIENVIVAATAFTESAPMVLK